MRGDGIVDVLMITYNRAAYTALSLPRLLETCDERTRVWLWHNGDHEETLEVVRSFADDPRVHRFHHSRENKRLTEPTNWLWSESGGDYLSKIDDDCLMPDGWVGELRTAHEDAPRLGVVGCWRFMPEDFDPALASWKIEELSGGRRILRNCWVEGSGYLMKRACVDELGPLTGKMSFPGYCKILARRGWIHGWLHPFLIQEHMDDPRSEHCVIRTDDDLKAAAPLTAVNFGIATVDERVEQIRRHAREVQIASLDPRVYSGWRRRLRLLLGGPRIVDGRPQSNGQGG